MKLLLGSFLLGGVCWLGAAVDIPVMPNFNNERASGKWHPLAIIFVAIQYPDYTLQAATKGDLMYNFQYSANGDCTTKTFRFAQFGVPGKFMTTSPNIVQIIDTDYNSYIITYIMQGMGAFLTLAGRQPTITPTLEEKFSEAATSVQVTGNVIVVSRTEGC